LKLPQAKGFHLELDVAYSGMVIAEADRPRFPKLAIAVDRASGFIGGCHLSDANDRQGAATLATVIQNALIQAGHRPETIRVQRTHVAVMLSKVVKELGIPIIHEAELPALNLAKEDMERRFSRSK